MKKPYALVPLALLSVALLSRAPARAGDDDLALRRRGDVEVEDGVLGRLDAGETRVRVVILAKEARGVGLLHDDPTERRRQVAAESTQEIRALLRSSPPGDGRASADPGAGIRYLWVANAVAAEVDRDQLAALRATDSVRKVILDREIRWLDARALAAPAPAPAGDGPENYGLGKIQAPAAWDEFATKGEGVRVGHIDTGVDANHPAMQGKVVAFRDFINGRSDSYDDQGHGTHSAGSIVGEGVGVAPAATLVVAKALNQFGSGSFSQLMEAMQWMLDPDGDPSTQDQPELVSNSWGADRASVGDEEQIFRDVVKAWREAGIVPVFAAGNAGFGTQSIPGGYPEAFAVGATDEQDHVADFSTGGPGDWDGETFVKPDVAAPGVAIVSAMPGGGYQTMNGTSMACPHVAGAVALVLSKHPDATVDQVIEALQTSAVDLGDSGHDGRYGDGRIDVLEAMRKLGGKQVVASLPALTR